MTKNSNELFGFESDLKCEVLSAEISQDLKEYIPVIDENYFFDKDTSLAIISGFIYNRKVLVQGLHGSGKSSHIEQIAARLGWPCIRVNLDGYITRSDLVGRDSIVIKDGLQVTEFKDGIIPWACKNPIALILDEYDAARPDVMFVLQRLLETEGKFTLIDQNRVITPNSYFRIFATSNTVGLGDVTGLYQGTNLINQAQLDRWNIVANLNYLKQDDEIKIIAGKIKELNNKEGLELIRLMVVMANFTRTGFEAGDISILMSPRTVINWAENYLVFKDVEMSFKYSFYNKCDDSEKSIISEYYQRCFAKNL